MRSLRNAAVAAGCLALLSTDAVLAQVAGGLQQPASVGAPARYGASPIGAWAPPTDPGTAYVNAYGDIVPSQYCGPVAGGGYGMPAGVDPYGGAYVNTEQCGPHYFDVAAEYLFYSRDDSTVGNQVFSVNGFADDAEVIANNITPPDQIRFRLSDPVTEDLNGYRLIGRVDVGALSLAEFTYSGLFSEDGGVSFSDGGSTRLSSIYSLYGSATNADFGSTVPPAAGPPTGTDFAETANAVRHSLSYDSELHNAEATYRRYWVGYNPRVSGTLLVGFRYTSLSESMGFFSRSETNDTLTVLADADNHLAGAQIGGDVWVTVVQGLRIGSEAKVGLYANDYSVDNAFSASDGDPVGGGNVLSGTGTSFLTEFKAMIVVDVAPSVSLKGGYELLYISDIAGVGDSLALAQPYGDINNISAQAPIRALSPASASGEAFYQGFHAGLEFVY